MAQWKSSTRRQPPMTKDELRLMLAEAVAIHNRARTPSREARRSKTTRPSWRSSINRIGFIAYKPETNVSRGSDADPTGAALIENSEGILDADCRQTYRTRDHRGATGGILSDSEWERAAVLHSANRAADEGAGPKISPRKLVCYRK